MVEAVSQAGLTPTNGYGLTETSAGVISIGGPDYVARPQSCGRPNPLTDVKVVDEAGLPVEGAPGELVVRGALVFKEYWKNQSATEKAFFPGGWFRTGDLARIDSDGFVTILDRLKDIIIRGGENISCAEVEDAAYKHDAVAEAAVFSLPHPRYGEEVGMAVVVREGAALPSYEGMRQFLICHLAAFKVPSRLFRWPDKALPRGGTGKVLKREVKKRVEAAGAGIVELRSAVGKSRL